MNLILFAILIGAAGILLVVFLAGRRIHQNSVPVRVAAFLILLSVAAFCGFGFLATFEPLDPGIQWSWRIVYAVVGLSALAGLVRAAIPHRKDRAGADDFSTID